MEGHGLRKIRVEVITPADGMSVSKTKLYSTGMRSASVFQRRWARERGTM
jgi:hypothetical protein